MLRVVFTLLLSLLGASVGSATPQVDGEPSWVGFQAVAEKASANWAKADAELQQGISEGRGRCGLAWHALLERAKAALGDKTRAWKAFLSELIKDADQRAAAAEKARSTAKAAMEEAKKELAATELLLEQNGLKRTDIKKTEPTNKNSPEVREVDMLIDSLSQRAAMYKETIELLQKLVEKSPDWEYAPVLPEKLSEVLEREDALYRSLYRTVEFRQELECDPKCPCLQPPRIRN